MPILAAAAIEGLPTLSDALWAVHATCTKSADGRTLYLNIPLRGLRLILR